MAAVEFHRHHYQSSNRRTTRVPWVEAIPPATLSPANLYEAQFARRISPPVSTTRTLTWDGSDTGTAGAQGGTGTWDTNTTANWWNAAANEAWPANGGTDDNAIFGGTAGTINIAPAGVAVRSITVNTAAYTISGGPIILNGQNPVITANHGGNTTNIASVIAGSAGLSKSGPSTVQLRAANRYSGDTRVLQGNLLIGTGNNRLPVTTRLILGDGSNSGTFQMNSRSQQVGGLPPTAPAPPTASLTPAPPPPPSPWTSPTRPTPTSSQARSAAPAPTITTISSLNPAPENSSSPEAPAIPDHHHLRRHASDRQRRHHRHPRRSGCHEQRHAPLRPHRYRHNPQCHQRQRRSPHRRPLRHRRTAQP